MIEEVALYKITIVGMGPGGEDYLTMEAYRVLTQSDNVILRTDQHPIVPFLVENGMRYTSCDAFYDQFETFEEVYEAIALEILEKAKHAPVVFAVPGNPFVAEKTVAHIIAHKEWDIRIVHGTSFIDAIVTAMKYDPVYGLVVLDALALEDEQLNLKKDHLFIQVYDQMVASSLKLKLMDFIEDETMVTVIQAAGIPSEERIENIPLYELDRHPEWFNHLTSVFVPGGKVMKTDMGALIQIMEQLRSETGCPWDREQNHHTLIPYLIEEAYEVKDAILSEDADALVDELGDVLLQVVFHATIANENGYFEMSDIIQSICEKMIRRHPHVFGDVLVNDSTDVLVNWQAIKDVEKANRSITESMQSVTFSLPALMRAQKIQKKASSIGFEWDEPTHAMDKIIEEVEELKAALNAGEQVAIREEFGDMLLIMSHVASMLKLDAEQVLMESIEKFVKRFKYIEDRLVEEGITPNPLIRDRMEALWEEAKKA